MLGKAFRPVNRSPVPLAKRSSGGGGGFGAGGSGDGPLSTMATTSILFSIVNRLSTATASAEWNLYRKPRDGVRVDDAERELVPVHAALDLVRKPNPFYTWGEFVESFQQHIELVGETEWVVARAGGIPIEMWIVRPDRMTPVPHPTEFLSGWLYRDFEGGKIPLRLDEVIQLRMPNPEDPYRGLGPVQSLLVDIDAARYTAEWNRNFFLNSAEPGGIIEVPDGLSDPEFDQMTERWNEQHRGVSRAHRVAIIEHGKWVDRRYTQKDMQFAEMRHLSDDVIMRAFGISKATLGITDDVNRASALAAEYQFARWLVVPRLDRIRQALNNDLLPMFYPPGTVPDVEFDYASPVDDDEDAANAERTSKATAAKMYIDAGFDPASVVEGLGLPAMQYGPDETPDPERDLLIRLVTGAPSLAPLILPLLGFDLPEPAAPQQPAAPFPSAPEASVSAAPVLAIASGADAHTCDRPPVRAAEDLGPVQDGWRAALDRLLEQWPAITAGQRAELRRQIIDAIDDGDLAALATLTASSGTAAERLTEALQQLAAKAADQAAVEAAAQDVTLTPAVVGGLAAVATTVAALLAAELALAAGREALRIFTPDANGEAIATAVDVELTGRSMAGTEAALGGALTGAQNRARVETMASGPVGSLYSDETLDGNTCGPCAQAHGRFVCTTDDLGPYTRLYTALGGYVNCEGGVRCRGTVTGVWRPATTGEAST